MLLSHSPQHSTDSSQSSPLLLMIYKNNRQSEPSLSQASSEPEPTFFLNEEPTDIPS